MFNNQWLQDGDFKYKFQDYTYSCFSACVQTALANFGAISASGRVIEDEFNQYYTVGLDRQSPAIDDINSYLAQCNWIANTNLHSIMLPEISSQSLFQIMSAMIGAKEFTLIGAMNGSGHAISIIKRGDKLYKFNPNKQANVVAEIPSVNISYVTNGTNSALRIDDFGSMEFCWLFYKN